MIDQTLASGPSRTLRPIPQLHGQVRIITASMLIPVFAAVFWFSIPRGTWPRVLVALAAVTLIYTIATILLSRVSMSIGHDGIIERRFVLGTNRVPAKRIESVLILTTYRGQSLDTVAQLFLVGATGDCLLRMPGQYWARESMEVMASAFDVPVRRCEEPISGAELRRDHAALLYWFERWPWVGGICVAGTIAAMSLLLIALTSPESLVVGS